MKFEVLKKSHLKRNVIVGVVVIAVIAAIILQFTKAKYRTAQSMPLFNASVNYDLVDLNAVAVYIKDESSEEGYVKSDSIPISGYIFNEEMSYCTIDGNRDDSITLSYDMDTQMLTVSPLTTKGTKCYLYFDAEQALLADAILSQDGGADAIIAKGTPDFSAAATTDEGLYATTDRNNTTSYYYRGAVNDNWVEFGGYYWRIIRVNGNGSIRLIYAGTSTTESGEDDQIGSSDFNSNRNYNYYVGLKYTEDEQHGTSAESIILGELNEWYNGLSSTYQNYIDSNAGFCSDREMASGYTWSANPSGTIRYAAYDRIRSGSPSLDCTNSSDILNIPVGLITTDETAYAGGVGVTANQSYYLYTNSSYWTMTPYDFYVDSGPSVASVSLVYQDGRLDYYDVNISHGIRPVINLKADTAISVGNGSSENPFVIATS